ncbi:MAG: hypothetical protein LUH23_09335 [Oscillospiraceae bacterium]|nr:hypothetical protein [Oscillospiraceae bacterium]
MGEKHLRDLLETYYEKDNTRIVRIKETMICFLSRFSGRFEDDILGLSSEDVKKILSGKLTYDDFKNKEGWGSISEYEDVMPKETWQIMIERSKKQLAEETKNKMENQS